MCAIVTDDTFFYALKVHIWHQCSAYNAYRKYMETPELYDWRSDHKKQKYGIKLRIRQQFLVRMKNRVTYYIVHDICVLMTMCYMHVVRQATWRVSLVWILYLWLPQVLWKLQPQLAAAQKIYGLVEKVKGEQNNHRSNNSWHLKFVTDECCHVEGKFFYDESDLATEAKYAKLRNWRTDLDMNDYKLPDLFWFLWTCVFCELCEHIWM